MASGQKSFQKIIILGNSGVGKTSLMNRYVNAKFSSQYKATIGADFLTKEVTISDRLVTLQIWDTAGQERFQSLGVAFYRGSDACVLVFDITDSQSFQALRRWKEEFIKQAHPPDADTFPFIVLANKADCAERRKVPSREAKDWCEQHGIPYYEVSAKTGADVEPAFRNVVERAVRRVRKERTDDVPVTLDLNSSSKSNKCQC